MELTQPRAVLPGSGPASSGPQELLANSGVERLLAHLADRLAGFPSLRRALLVGARARGEHHPRAEVELAFSIPGASSEEWARLIAQVEQTPTLLPLKSIRLEACDPEQRLLAETEGVLFYHPLDKPWADFRESLDRLGLCLTDDLSSPVVRDGILFRFSRTVDLFHRLLRTMLSVHGIPEKSFKDALVQAYHQGWIADEERWLSLLQAKFWVERAYDDERISLLVEKIGRHYALLSAAARTMASAAGLD